MWTVAFSVVESFPLVRRSQSTSAPPFVGAVAELFSVGSVPDEGSEHGQAERYILGVEIFGHGRWFYLRRCGGASGVGGELRS
jgi:hypothetical protein